MVLTICSLQKITSQKIIPMISIPDFIITSMTFKKLIMSKIVQIRVNNFFLN